MKVVFCSSEVSPFAKTGGLGDVCGALPLALEKEGVEVAVMLPGYKSIDRKKYGIKKINSGLSSCKIGKNIPVYLIEEKAFFNRDGYYGDKYGDYWDNLDRFRFFCRRSLEALKEVNFKADIVHCHDWHTALIPSYLKFWHQSEPFYRKMKSIFSIHNLAFQGVFPDWDYFKLGLSDDLFSIDGFEFYGNINLLKGGVVFSDCVSTVSPGYAKEIQTEELGCGLAGVIRAKKPAIKGILNGLNYDDWDPAGDKLIARKYSPVQIEAKAKNKNALQKMLKLKERADAPLFGFVARLSSQKGLDLINETMDAMMKENVQMVFLGTGDGAYAEDLRHAAKKYPSKVAISLKYDESLSHQIYAGSDFFLMPSIYEPCGLSQMIALRYGTLPLVFKTGGLADTVTHFNSPDGGGNGFVFDEYEINAFMKCFKTAVDTYKNKKIFNALVKKAFTFNFSWEKSAKKYKELYRQCSKSA